MAKYTGDDVYVSVAGVVISDHVDSVDIKETYGSKDVTGMGASATQNVLNKAKTCTIDIGFISDYAASQVFATLKTIVGSNTGCTVIVKPTSATVSATNPQATMAVALLPEWDPINVQSVGDVGKCPAHFINGDSTGIVWTP
jgi:hypothetical protein